jgi:hypothetical protein
MFLKQSWQQPQAPTVQPKNSIEPADVSSEVALSDADLEKVSGGQQFLAFNFKLVSVGPGGYGTAYDVAKSIGTCTATHD